jgi:hypothetical protein
MICNSCIDQGIAQRPRLRNSAIVHGFAPSRGIRIGSQFTGNDGKPGNLRQMWVVWY